MSAQVLLPSAAEIQMYIGAVTALVSGGRVEIVIGEVEEARISIAMRDIDSAAPFLDENWCTFFELAVVAFITGWHKARGGDGYWGWGSPAIERVH